MGVSHRAISQKLSGSTFSISKNNELLSNNNVFVNDDVDISEFSGTWLFLHDSNNLVNYQKSKKRQDEQKENNENIILESPVTAQIVQANSISITNNYTVKEGPGNPPTSVNCSPFTTYINSSINNGWGPASVEFKGPGYRPGQPLTKAYARYDYNNSIIYTCYNEPTVNAQRTISRRNISTQYVNGQNIPVLYETFTQYTIGTNGNFTYVPNAPVYVATYYKFIPLFNPTRSLKSKITITVNNAKKLVEKHTFTINKEGVILFNNKPFKSNADTVFDFKGIWTFVDDTNLQNYQKSKNKFSFLTIIFRSFFLCIVFCC